MELMQNRSQEGELGCDNVLTICYIIATCILVTSVVISLLCSVY